MNRKIRYILAAAICRRCSATDISRTRTTSPRRRRRPPPPTAQPPANPSIGAAANAPQAITRQLGSLDFKPCSLSAPFSACRRVEAQCATLQVPENRAAPKGRKIGLKIAWLPADATMRRAGSGVHARRRPRPVGAGNLSADRRRPSPKLRKKRTSSWSTSAAPAAPTR